MPRPSPVIQLQRELEALAAPEQSHTLSRFFKTGPGQYGEGDLFLGIKVPVTRKIAKKYRDIPLAELEPLLASRWHEIRFSGLLILADHYQRAKGPSKAASQAACFRFLLEHLSAINNWDLVDVIVPTTIGDYLYHHPEERQRLSNWISSPDLWQRRIALLASFAFIRQGELGPTFTLASEVLHDKQDLIHKAAGWMLREAGERDQSALLAYLETYAAVMPRTMLRYAIEKLSPSQRQELMGKKKAVSR